VQNIRWLWGPVALALIAVFNVSDFDLLSTHSGMYSGFSKYSVASLGIPALATVAGVWLTQHWQWLLAVGTTAALVTTIEAQAHFAALRPGATSIITSIGVAGTVLIVIGALAAAQDAALAALVVGAQVLATLFRGLYWLDNQLLRPAALEIVLGVLAVAGGALAVHGVRTGKITRTEPISRRAALVGSAAAFLPIVLIGVGLVVRSELHRVLVAVVAGAVLLLCTAGLTLALGRGAFLKTATAGFVLFAVSAPAALGLYFSGSHLTTYGSAAVIGLGFGILAAHLGRSTVVAAAACAVLAVLMWTVVEVTGRYDDVVQGGLGSLIIALVVAAVTSSAATAASGVLHLRALPVVAGPLLLSFALGFREVVQLFLSYDKIPHAIPEGDYTPLWAALTAIAAVALAAIVVLDRARERLPAAPI
jgi:hypothetical protein